MTQKDWPYVELQIVFPNRNCMYNRVEQQKNADDLFKERMAIS